MARLSFNELKRPAWTTDGNLSVHASKPEDARTDYRLLPAGLRAFERHLGHMEAIIKASKT